MSPFLINNHSPFIELHSRRPVEVLTTQGDNTDCEGEEDEDDHSSPSIMARQPENGGHSGQDRLSQSQGSQGIRIPKVGTPKALEEEINYI